MRKKVITVLCALFCLACVAQAQNIIWVSDGYYQAAPAADQGFVDLLTDQGYNVTRLEDPRSLDQGKVDQMNAADLVIFGRQANSGDYDDGNEPTLWNSVTSPMIQQNAYLARSNRWKWINFGSDPTTTGTDNVIVVKADDPVYDFLNVAEGDSIDLAAEPLDHLPFSDPGNGTIIGRRDNAQYPRLWIVRWETGQEFYPGAGQYAAGPRLYCIARDNVSSLTSLGQAVLLNAVYDMSGATFNRPPAINAEYIKAVWAGSDLQLSASVKDDGKPEPASITLSWSVISSPENSNVVFSATDIVDPVVSFDTAGVYELQLEANDGELAANHTISITVADPADKKVVAHWSLDTMAAAPGTLVVDDASDNDGLFRGVGDDPETSTFIEDPNIITPGWVGAQALDFYGDSWIEAAPGAADPNAFNLRTGVTVAAWVKSNGGLFGDYGSIVNKGEGAWRISATAGDNDGGIHFNCSGTSSRINSQRKIADDNWHHVVGIYDAITEKAYLYIDGVLDTEIEAKGLINVNNDPVWIGNNVGQQARIWGGAIDDIYVYNYGISEADVLALAAMAPKVPSVYAGEDVEYIRGSEDLALTGTVIDDGLPQAAAISWSVTAKPEGAADPIFTPVDNVETTVKFAAQGEYELTLTADDTVAAISDSIIVTVIDPTCQDVIDSDLLLIGDINQDCYVDLNDFAIAAANWLSCNNPQDSNCLWPF